MLHPSLSILPCIYFMICPLGLAPLSYRYVSVLGNVMSIIYRVVFSANSDIPQVQGVQATIEVTAHIEVTGAREGEGVVHMVAEAMAVAWGKTHGSGTAVGAAAPGHPEEAIRAQMALVRQRTVEVNVAPKAKEHRDAILVQHNLPAATVHPQLLQFEHKILLLEWMSLFVSIRFMCQLNIGSQRRDFQILEIQFCSPSLCDVTSTRSTHVVGGD